MTEFIVFLLVIYVLYEAVKRRNVESELRQQLSLFQRHLAELESKLRELEGRRPAGPAPAAVPQAQHERDIVPIDSAITYVPPEHKPAWKEAPNAPAPVSIPKAPPRRPEVTQPASPIVAPPVAPPVAASGSEARPVAPLSTQPATPMFEHIVVAASAPQESAPPKRRVSLEERLGTNWLSKVGVVLLVLGVVSFLIYQFGGTPAGKVFLGYTGALLALGWGVWLDRKPDFKVFARSCIGGAWALLYFTTFAMNHVAAAHVLDSEALDLALMLLVATGMVAHSLRYKSQAATALAFLLGFTAVAISHTDVTGLAANAVLALALAVIALRLNWFEMELIGIVAAYATHLIWLEPLIERGERPVPGADISVALLIAYWAIFRASYVLRRIANPHQESLSTIAALANSFALLAMLKYQAAHPELAFWALLGFGAIEIVLAELPRIRRRRTAFLVLTTLGVTLIVAAFPFRYGGATLAILWLFCSQALIFVGVFTREIHFRRLGEIAAIVAGSTIFYEGAAASHNLTAGLVFSIAALLFWLDSEFLPSKVIRPVISDFERPTLRLISYFGAAAAAMAAWVALPEAWIPAAWAATAALALFLSLEYSVGDLRTEASLLMMGSLGYVFAVHIADVSELHLARTARIVPAVLVAALAYGLAPWLRTFKSKIRPLITTAATLVVVLLLWRECNSAWVGVAWVAVAIAVAVAARTTRFREFALQAHCVAAAAFLYAVVVNLPSAAMYQHAQQRLITAGAIAIALYAIAQLSRFDALPLLKEIGPLHTWGASALIAALAWYELSAVAVVPAWTIFGVALLEAGILWRSRNLRLQSYCVLTAAFVRMWFVNLLATTPLWLGMSPRVYTLVPLAAAFAYCYVRLTSAEPELGSHDLGSLAPPLNAWLATATVAALLRFEVADAWVITAWAALALAVLAVAWMFERRLFIYQAFILALAVFGRGMFYNLAERSNFASNESVLLKISVAAAVLFASLYIAFRLRATAPEAAGTGIAFQKIAARPEQVMFFLPVALITLALAFCVETGGPLTVAWGIEGVVLFIFALLVSERSFRLTGLILLLACVAKIISFDIWGHRISDRQRYLTLIVIGAALLLVSFLYNRHRDRVRQLL